jgi:PAS domain S-box-containing protein
MTTDRDMLDRREELARLLAEAQATIGALVSGQIDAVVDPESQTPVLLSKAQEALRESEERYRLIVEATSDGIIQVDPQARITFVNRRFAEMLDYGPHEIVGKSICAFMSTSAAAVAVEAIQGARRGGVVRKEAIDTTFRHRTGAEIAVDFAVTLLADTYGRHPGALVVVRDITEQKKLQSQLMVSDRMASVGTLAAGVAHEINNPLAAVIANLDYFATRVQHLAGGDSEEITGPIQDARDAAQRVRLIVRDLKIFSRSPIDEPRGAVDVNAIMESSLRMAWNEVRHRARLVKLYATVPGVEANEARLGQVFLNLVVNAAQALPEGQAEQNEIRITTRLDESRVIIEVTDTGPGIPPEIIGRIFDAFFTTKPVGVGMGLGLAICHRIVTDMGGRLTVASKIGKGTTFQVALPISTRGSREPPVPVDPVPVAGRRGRVLVVDDEKLVIRAVKRILSADHEVVTLVSAAEALALCASGEEFDVILCDLMMPDMTGMDLHRELTRVAPEQASRMIFMTGGAFTPKAREFLSEVPKEHLEKPFDPANLRAIVRRHLRTNREVELAGPAP